MEKIMIHYTSIHYDIFNIYMYQKQLDLIDRMITHTKANGTERQQQP